ncbi:hypothetical protein E3P99_01323 [Wallemia hederae]|uniref:Haloacid dehalogenase, type II n=1 Tax=Wallemia hederae TaxID=1540922 RepID=A0A4T0FQZ3_9BASI|nr:hypothetical protein E3P99_01323 [Wallemia hederae]
MISLTHTPHSHSPNFQALVFDAFGTTLNWRHTMLTALESRAATHAHAAQLQRVNWRSFLQDWREAYKAGTREYSRVVVPLEDFVDVDTIHRRALDDLVVKYDIADVYSPVELDELTANWHSLSAWPDASHGLDLLHRKYKLATLSGAHSAQLVDMSRHADLRWDLVVGADMTGTYKPNRTAYLNTLNWLGVQPHEAAMVAAHANDCRAARSLGMRTVYVERTLEEDEPESITAGEFDLFIDGKTDIDNTVPTHRQTGFIELAERLSV